MSFTLKMPREVLLEIAAKAKARRLALNVSQKELAERSGVSLGSVKRFERSGLVSLFSLLEIALVLGSLGDFAALFATRDAPPSLFRPEPRQRKRSGKKKRMSLNTLPTNLDVFCILRGTRHFVGRLAERNRSILFEYADEFLRSGIELSPFKLPLRPGVFEDKERIFDGLPGARRVATPLASRSVKLSALLEPFRFEIVA